MKAIYSQVIDRCRRGLDRGHLAATFVVFGIPRRPAGQVPGDYGRADHNLVRHGGSRELIEILFPLAYAISAEGYLDKYGPEERYDILKLIPRVTVSDGAHLRQTELPTSAAVPRHARRDRRIARRTNGGK